MYEGAGLGPEEVDVFNPYDGYAPMAQFFLEAFQWLQNCVLAKLNVIKENVVAKLPKAQPDDVTEEVIAREIRGQCLNQKQAFLTPPDSYLQISDFFKQFTDNLAKFEILRISIGTQAALDLLNKEEARG